MSVGLTQALPAMIGPVWRWLACLQLWSAQLVALPPSQPKARLGAAAACLACLQALSHSIS